MATANPDIGSSFNEITTGIANPDRDGSSSLGITTGASRCGGCQERDGTTFCQDCGLPLCSACEKSHKNLPLTKDHSIIQLVSRRSSMAGTGDSEPLDVRCKNHSDEVVSRLCTQCELFLCRICHDCPNKRFNTVHNVIELNSDISLLQRMCTGTVTTLLDGVQKLDIETVTLRSKVEFLKEARSSVATSRDNICLLIRDTTGTVENDIQQEISREEAHFGDSSHGLKHYTETAEIHISNMNVMRNIQDVDTLVNYIERGKQLTDAIKSYIQLRGVVSNIPAINQNSPHIENLKKTHYEIQHEFIALLQRQKRLLPQNKSECIFEQQFLTHLKTFDVEFHNYRIMWMCEAATSQDKTVVLYAPGHSSLYLYDVDNSVDYREQSSMTLSKLIAISGGGYINFSTGNSNPSTFHILNRNFATEDTIKGDILLHFERSTHPLKIWNHKPGSIIVCQCTFHSPFTLYFTEVQYHPLRSDHKLLTKITFGDGPEIPKLALHNGIIIAVTSSLIYRVGLHKSDVAIYNIKPYVSRAILSVCVDHKHNTYIADDEGYIHRFTEDMKHDIILNVGCGSNIKQIAMRNGRLCVLYFKHYTNQCIVFFKMK